MYTFCHMLSVDNQGGVNSLQLARVSSPLYISCHYAIDVMATVVALNT